VTKFCVALLLLAAAGAASAASIDQFRSGHFAEAASQGRAESTPASLILAGRSELTVACFETTDAARALALVDAAEHDFDAALAKAPGSNEALLQKATAIGYRAKLTKSGGQAKEARRRFEAAVAREPNNALAWASVAGWHAGSVATLGKFLAGTVLGAKLDVAMKDFDTALAWASVAGWHAGSVATLGKFLAGTVLGAKLDVAMKDFDTALAKDPHNPLNRVFYAFTLLDLDTDNAPRAAALLREADRLPPRDAIEALTKRGVAAVLPLLDHGDAKGARAMARRLLPFGTLA